MTHKKTDKSKIILYKNNVEVKLDGETVWLTQAQMAQAFNTERSVITKHIRNILKSRELMKNSVCAKFAHTADDGKSYQTQFYNLDMIISVGYRVNSKRGTQFRIWATNVLKKHLVDGYTINQKRLRVAGQKYQQLWETVKLLSNVVKLDSVTDETKGLIQVISEYSKALNLLEDFDNEQLGIPKGTKRAKIELTYEKAQEIITALRKKFKSSNLVGLEKDNSFKSSLGAIYQTAKGKDVYPTVEEKAAHLLYFVTKNHSFIDGNKRIAAALFVSFLKANGLLLTKTGDNRIDNNCLVALTLLIAVSKPEEKDILIKVIINLLH